MDCARVTHIGLQTVEQIEKALYQFVQFLQDSTYTELFRYLIAQPKSYRVNAEFLHDTLKLSS